MTPTSQALEAAAREAGLSSLHAEAGADFHGRPTTRFTFASEAPVDNGHAAEPLLLELTEGFDAAAPELHAGLVRHLHDLKGRLGNPHPEHYVTMSGLPLRFTGFQWPFHRSTSGADTLLVHGTVWLADGTAGLLHAKVAASMTVTFAEIVAAPEQPYAEDFIYNAVRKTFDYGQLELLKSGNRQPVPVTTRYYSRWQKKFLFTDTTDEQRVEFLARKAFWLSGILGAAAGAGSSSESALGLGSDAGAGQPAPVWLADPRDAQYLNATPELLLADADALAAAGFVTPSARPGYAAASPALLAREPEYRAELAAALQSIKPAFNESMRAGLTNM